jgi:hypothetical protein
MLKGPHGLATVSYLGPLGIENVEQDLHAVAFSNPMAYAGSNPRFLGTNVPDPTYVPDMFRLERLSNSGWRVRDVGYPGHFDPAQPGPLSKGTSLEDCR